MRMFLLSDSADTLTGMRLAGIEGKGVKTAEELQKAAKECIDTDIAILLITNKLADKSREFVDELKTLKCPLIVEIPDKEHCTVAHDSITRYVQEAMGIKL